MKTIKVFTLLVFLVAFGVFLSFRAKEAAASTISGPSITSGFSQLCPGANSTYDICFYFEAYDANTGNPVNVNWSVERECNLQGGLWYNNFKPNWHGPNCNSGSGSGTTFTHNAGSCTLDWKVSATANGYDALPAYYPGGDGGGKTCFVVEDGVWSNNCPLMYGYNGNVARWTVYMTPTGGVPVSPPPSQPSPSPTPSPGAPTPTPTPSPTTVNITGKHVDTIGNLFNPVGKNVTISGPTNSSSTDNPWSFNTISPGTYTVTATRISGYSISVASCVNSTCSASSTFDPGNIVSNLILNAGSSADIWFKYTAVAASPTPTPSASPSPGAAPGGESTTNIQCNRFTANWSVVSGATQYRLEFTSPDRAGPDLVPVGNVTSWTFWQDVISPNKTYTWRVQAYVGGAYGSWGALQTVNTPSCPASPTPVPPTNCVIFYENASYGGGKKELFTDTQWFNDFNFDNGLTLDNNVSSFTVPAGVTLTIYADGNYLGASRTYNGVSDPNLATVGWDNRISSMKVTGCPPPPPRRNIFGYKWVTPDSKAFGTAAGEVPPGSTVNIYDSANNLIHTDGTQDGMFFKPGLAIGSYKVEVYGVSGWLVQSCVGASANTSENNCSAFFPDGQGHARNVTFDSIDREVSVWFYFKRAPTIPTIPAISCVSLFSNEDYTGTRVDIFADSPTLPGSIDNLSRSVAMAPGVSATVYDVANFGGTESKNLLTNIPSLAAFTYDGSTRLLERTISSIKVFGCAVPTPTPTAPPAISGPSNLQVSTSCEGNLPKVVFTWSAATNHTNYWLDVNGQAWIDANNPSPWSVKQLAGSDTSFTWSISSQMDGGFPPAPANNSSYFWRMKAFNINNGLQGSHRYPPSTGTPPGVSFATPDCSPAPPTASSNLIVNAVCGAGGLEVTFSWNPSTNHTGYWLDINADAWTGDQTPVPWGAKQLAGAQNSFVWNATSPVDDPLRHDVDGSLPGDQAVPVSNALYFWRVQAFNVTSGLSSPHVYPPNSLSVPGVSFSTPDCRPNLQISSFNIQEGGPGEPVQATLTVLNAGSNPTPSGVNIEIAISMTNDAPECLSGLNKDFVGTTGPLGAGESRANIVVPVTLPATVGNGQSAVALIDSEGLDFYCAIDESNEGDNTRVTTFNVTGFDLMVELVSGYKSLFESDENATIRVRVTNTTSALKQFDGGILGVFPKGPAPNCPVSGQVASTTRPIPTLPIGASTEIDIPFNSGSDIGPWVYTVYALPECLPQRDLNWSNNGASFTWRLNVSAWFKTVDGDAGAHGGFRLTKPAPEKQSSYLLIGSQLVNVGSSKWMLDAYTKPLISSDVYGYFKERFFTKADDHLAAISGGRCDISAGTFVGSGATNLIVCPGNAVYQGAPLPAGDTVWFIEGNLTVESNLALANSTDTISFIVRDNIIINTDVEEVDGIYIAGQTFRDIDATLGESGKQLVINGGVYGGDVKLERKLGGLLCDPNPDDGIIPTECDNEITPAEQINFEPKYIFRLSPVLGVPAVSWREVSP